MNARLLDTDFWNRKWDTTNRHDADSKYEYFHFYRATMTSPELDPGSEALEARLFAEDEVPWDQIAFRTVRETLQLFFADRRRSHFEFHAADIA